MITKKSLQLMFGLLILGLYLAGCSIPTPASPTVTNTPMPPTQSPVIPVATSLPITTNPVCGTIVTMVEDSPEMKFGETGIDVELVEYYYDAVVVEGGLAEPRNGEIQEVRIDDKSVALTRQDFDEGFIHTEDFGQVKVFVTASLTGQCYLLIATPEQVTEIVDWLR